MQDNARMATIGSEAKKIRTKKIIGWSLAVVGAIGMISTPSPKYDEFELVKPQIIWTIGTLVSMIVCLSGFPGIFIGRLTSRHLKIIDLIWILGSVVGVCIGVIHYFQEEAKHNRESISKHIESVVKDGLTQSTIAIAKQCDSQSTLSSDQCQILRRINNAFRYDGYLAPQIVERLCPFPFKLSKLPEGFSIELVNTFLAARDASKSPELPVMRDAEAAERWEHIPLVVSLLMMILVSVRVMKSVAEVFWMESGESEKLMNSTNSGSVDKLLAIAKQWVSTVDDAVGTLSGEVTDKRHRLAISSLNYAQELCDSIVLLIEHRRIAGALALVRPQQDAFIRGLWIRDCAPDNWAEQAEFKFPGKKDMIIAIASTLDDESNAAFQNALEGSKDFLDDATHGGKNQLYRRFWSDGSIGYSAYPEEILFVLARTLLIDYWSRLGVCTIFENKEAAQRLHAEFEPTRTTLGVLLPQRSKG